MPCAEYPASHLRGFWRDRICHGDGRVTEGTVQSNTIVVDCRRILSSFMAGAPSLGVQGMQFGAGLAAWDAAGPPAATAAQTALVDASPFTVPAAAMQFDFVDDLGAVVAGPTNRLQIVATLGPAEPPWPDANHIAGSLREFGLIGELNGAPALINYVTHPVINKDPASTLERTLWLVF